MNQSSKIFQPFPRRDFLKSSALGIGAIVGNSFGLNRTSAAINVKKDEFKKELIDAHVHVWTPDLKSYPLAEGFTRKNMKPASFTPQQLMEHAKPCGVSRVVLIQMSYYKFDNSYMLDTIKKYPGVYSGVAVIDEDGKAPAQQMRQLKKQGVRGFRIRPIKRKPETWLTGEGMQKMWKCGAEEELAMCNLVNIEDLPEIDRMAKKYPETPVVIDHFARIGVDGKLRDKEITLLCNLAKHKKMYVKLSAFYALGKKKSPYTDLTSMIRRLLDAFGPERLMWATDCPFQVNPEHNYLDSVELIRSQIDFLSQADKDWILRKTAEKVFFKGIA